MKFTHATVDVHIQSSPRDGEHKLRVPGYEFTLPGTHLVLVVHRAISETGYPARFETAQKLSKRWVVTEPTTGKRLMDHSERESRTREDAVVSAGKTIKKNGMNNLAMAIMESLPKLLGLEVRTPDGVVVTPSQEGGAQ